jgi:8-oxo-dGTP pyrophosphatase MutT (NUDIX family)
MSSEDCFHLGVKALIRNTNNQLLLLKINPSEYPNYNGDAYWDIPGGRVQKDDTVESTLKREVEEETGIKAITKVEFFYSTVSNLRIPVANGTVGLIIFAYLCEVVDQPAIRLSAEHIDFSWFNLTESAALLQVKYAPDFIVRLQSIATI